MQTEVFGMNGIICFGGCVSTDSGNISITESVCQKPEKQESINSPPVGGQYY